MKKIGAIVLLIAGVISAAVGVITLLRLKSSVPSGTTIIGGADGPTTVFFCGKDRSTGIWSDHKISDRIPLRKC